MRVHLGQLAGATVHKVLLSYDNPDGNASSVTTGWVDDIRIGTAKTINTADGSLTNFVDTRRGSSSSGDYTRGATFPATAVPNGFNFYTPLTEGNSNIDLYKYQQSNTSNNKPRLEGLAISHQPSRWINDRNQVQFMPSITTDSTPNAALDSRRLEFSHDNEVAQPDHYAVTFDNGIKAEIAPADHAVVFRFTFPASANNRGTIFLDRVNNDASFTLRSNADEFEGWTQGGPEGTTRMYFYGRFSKNAVSRGDATNRSGAKYVQFDTTNAADRVIELRVATSLMSVSQAEKNFEREANNKSFADIQLAAQAAWDERLGVVGLPGASDEQKVSMYSSLYRLNLYPNAQHEDTSALGSSTPVWKYASPVNAATGTTTASATGAKINDGKMYVNNGFWDTYRTAWPLYNFLYPEVAEELIDGFVEQYRAGGWIARWSTPGYEDSMTGTSSDASFADAYIAGALPTALAEEVYAAGLKNATALSAANIKSDGNYGAIQVGRKSLNRSIFLGYMPSSEGESVSWGLEGLINDYALGKMAAKLSSDPNIADETKRARYADEAHYLLTRAQAYVNQFDSRVGDPDDANTPLGFFAGRQANGDWVMQPGKYTPANRNTVFNPEDWDAGVSQTGHHTFTETNGWNFAFHAPYDADGLAALYGGQAGLIAKLDTFFATQEKADTRRIHETYEARDVRMGQWGASNQVSFHIPWVYVGAGKPSKAQRITRDAVQRLYVGSEIGQGYLGDEDNGAMSAWYVFSALGFYPLAVGSGQYAVGSPLHGQAVINPLGRDGTLTINAANNSIDNVYVQSATLDGVPMARAALAFADILDGQNHTVNFQMGNQPSTWSEHALDVGGPTPSIDILDPAYATVSVSGASGAVLTDNNSSTAVTFSGQTGVISAASKVGALKVHEYTITNAAGAASSDPKAWKLEGSNDGVAWTVVDERSAQSFPWRTQTRPFKVASPGSFSRYRLTIGETGGNALALSEIEFLVAKGAPEAGDLAIHAADAINARAGSAFTGELASISGGDGGAVTATADYGNGPVVATVAANPFGGYTIAANHTFTTPGTHTVTVVATQGASEVVASIRVNVYVDNRTASQVALAANVSCFSEVGIGGSCDGEGYAYNRAKVRAAGVDFGTEQSVQVEGTAFRYTLPDVTPGQPDTLTGRGQVIPVIPNPGSTRITFLGMANQGTRNVTAWLKYDDGTEQEVTVTFGDWVDRADNPIAGNVQVFNAPGRLQGAGEESTVRNLAVFATTPVDLAAGKQLVSIRLEDQGDDIPSGKAHIVAFGFNGTAVPALNVAPAGPANSTVKIGAALTRDLATVSGGRGTYAAYVNWGDGSGSQPAAVTDGKVTASHTYAAKGSYAVSVTVTDGELSEVVAASVVVEQADDPGPGPGPGPGPDPQPGTVRLTGPAASKRSQAYNSTTARRIQLSTTVTGAANGQVTFRAGGVILGTAKVARTGNAYRAKLRVPAKLKVGRYTGITATLSTGGKVYASPRNNATLRVVKATTKRVGVTAKRFRAGSKPKITVRVAKLSNGRWADGTLRIRVGNKSVRTVRIAAKRKGKVTLTLPRRYSSSIRVRARYVPKSTKVAKAKWSKQVRVRVR